MQPIYCVCEREKPRTCVSLCSTTTREVNIRIRIGYMVRAIDQQIIGAIHS